VISFSQHALRACWGQNHFIGPQNDEIVAQAAGRKATNFGWPVLERVANFCKPAETLEIENDGKVQTDGQSAI
jgi:hypothetical protein